MHHLRRLYEKIIYIFSDGRRQEKNITYQRPYRQFFLRLQDIGRIKSITEDNLMFFYEQFFRKLSTNTLSCRPSFFLVRAAAAVGRKKVASIWLKIGLRLAYG